MLCLPGTRQKLPLTKQALCTHDMQDKNLLAIEAVENPARWLNNLTIAGTPKLPWPTAALRVIGQLPHMIDDALDEFRGSYRILQCDVVGDGLKIAQGRFCPDYFSHRARRFLA